MKRSNFTLVFFKASRHANPGAENFFTESSSNISIQIFLKFLIHQLTVKYCFEHTIQEYTMILFVQSNTLLLGAVFENSSNMCAKIYKLDLVKSFSAPALAWEEAF